MERHEIVIIGGGPAGLGCAARLRKVGIRDVVVLERDSEAGGVPRHCGHWGFGWESHRRLMSGPDYAAQLRNDANGIDLRTSATVLGFSSAHCLRIQTGRGVSEMEAGRVIFATGARESTRAARLVGGARLPQVMNTGTLQQLVYLKSMKPFSRPVILGGEWVSFSALMTCHHAGMRPAAMIVEDVALEAPWFFAPAARLRYGVPVHRETRLVAIRGKSGVEGVEVEHRGQRRVIACDGVVVSGKFVPENSLFASGPLAGRPAHVTIIGNASGPLKTAGRCVVEAKTLADGLKEHHE